MAQQAIAQSFYGESSTHRYSLHLVFDSERVFGNLQYSAVNENSTKIYRVKGSFSENQLDLFELITKESLFRGEAVDQGFSGFVAIESLNLNQKIDFRRANLNTGLALKSVSVAGQQMLRASDPLSPSALADLQVLVPSAGNNSLQTALNKFYRFGNEQLDAEAQLKQQTEQFFSQYSELANISSTGGASFQWIKQMETVPVLNRSGHICLKKSTYAFTGGAHGMEHHEFGIFDFNGNKLDFNDLFVENSSENLKLMITEKIKKALGLQTDEMLSENGFFVDMVDPNSNLFVFDAGIGFYYNSYEIAPYSTGHTMVMFQFNEIKPLLKAGMLGFFE